MNRAITPGMAFARVRGPWTLLLVAAAVGCHKAPPEKNPIDVAPAVQVTKLEKRNLHHEVGQPGYVYAYQQTSIFPKVAGFVDKWTVDIGDRIKKGQLMAHVYVPELHARLREKQALVQLDEVHVRLAESDVAVADQNVKVAAADVKELNDKMGKYEAEVKRWQSEVKRLEGITSVVDRQILAESRLQLQSNLSSRNAAQSAVLAGESRKLARQADLDKAKVSVDAARAQILVDKASEEHLAALVSYTELRAPYDGTVIVRNVNTGDYVEPRYGDETPQIGGYVNESTTRGTPLYVVAATSTVRVYVDVPEMEAQFVQAGTKARIRIESLDAAEIDGTVARTSWALNVRSRTLRAEIDLDNKESKLRPGMYAYAMVEINRQGALCVPATAVIEIGNHNTIFLAEKGKAVRTPVQTGINDGKFVEVFRKRVNGKWEKFTGNEEVILGDLPALRDGETVRVSQDKR